MLFKSNVPMAHRVAFFLAGLASVIPLLRTYRGAHVSVFDFLPAALAWLLVAYQWRERRTLKWQLRNAEGHGHHTPADLMQAGLDRLPDYVYVVLAILTACALFMVFSHG